MPAGGSANALTAFGFRGRTNHSMPRRCHAGTAYTVGMSALPPLLGPTQMALMARPVSIIVGTSDAAHRPHVTRGAGARLADHGRAVTVLLPHTGSEQVIADLQANGRIAVVFSEPTTHQTLQLKGRDAAVGACTPQHEALAARYLEGFIDEIGRLGFTAEVAHTILRLEGGLVPVQFTLDEAFEQTPGPSAGARLCPPGPPELPEPHEPPELR